MPLRVLHTSDLHLDSLGDMGCNSLKSVVDLVDKTNVDLLIIAGDLFDYYTVDESVIRFAVEQLEHLPIPVVILPGNHDCLAPGSVFERVDLWNGASNIRVFTELDGETFAFPDLEMSVWGKPLTFSQGFAVQPLADAPFPQGNEQWRIAMVHGYYVHPEPTPFINSHDRKEEIVNSGWDYIALGHSITFECVCNEPVKAYYCGSPSTSGTVAIVAFAEDTGVKVTCHSLLNLER